MENSKGYELSFNEELQSTILVYSRRCEESEFKEALIEMLKLFRLKGCKKHMTNTSKMGVVSVANQKWVASEIVSKMKESVGDEKLQIALVLGDDIFATVAAKNIERLSEDETKLVVRDFPNAEAASNWLKT